MECRTLLEVFKWLPVKTVLAAVCLTCRLWRQISDLDELWIQFCELMSFSSIHTPTVSYKEAFKIQHRCSTYVCLVQEDCLWIYDCRRNLFRDAVRLDQKVDVNAASSYAFLPDGSLLCTGGGIPQKPSAACWQLSPYGHVLRLQCLSYGRSEHGLLPFLDSIFIFGGWGGHTVLKSCEKLPMQAIEVLPRRCWTQISDMLRARCYFTPCAYTHFVYLCGGGTNFMERFDPRTEEFCQMELFLPEGFGNHCAVVKAEELIVISEKSVCRWKLGVEITAKRSAHESWFSWGNMNGILVGSCLFSPLGTTLRRFDISTHELRIISLPRSHNSS